MYKRPDTVCKLECINKFSVVVSSIWKTVFFENFYSFLFYEDPLLLEPFPFYWLFCISPCRPFGKIICRPYKSLSGKYGFLITLCIR